VNGFLSLACSSLSSPYDAILQELVQWAEYLELLKAALQRPELTLGVTTLFRPVVLKVVAALVNDVVQGRARPSAAVALSFSYLVELAPQVKG
jgi:hypothetical protein